MMVFKRQNSCIYMIVIINVDNALNPSAKIRRIIYTATQKNIAILQLRKFKTNFSRTGWASGDIPHIPPSPTSNPYINPIFQLWLRPKFVLNFRN